MKHYLWSFNVSGYNGIFLATQSEIDSIIGKKILLSYSKEISIIIPHTVENSNFEKLMEVENSNNFYYVNHGINPLNAIDISDIKEPKITSRKYGGDDAYSWAVFVDDKVKYTGLSRASLAHYKKLAYEAYIRKQIKYMQ